MKRDYIIKTLLSNINPCKKNSCKKKEDKYIPNSQIYLSIKVFQAINEQNQVLIKEEKENFFLVLQGISKGFIYNIYNMLYLLPFFIYYILYV